MSDAGSTDDLPDDVVAVGPRSGIQYVRLTASMGPALEALELLSFPTADPDELYDAAELAILAAEFPEGTVVGFDGPARDQPIAAGLGIRVEFDFDNPQHNLKEFVESAESESGHDPNGRWYYGTDIVVSPAYRRRGIGKELYDLRKQICVDLGLDGIVAGGVIPGYAAHKADMTADEYIVEVTAGRLYDPTLTFQLENGFEAPCALANYISDPEVDNWASLIVWRRPSALPDLGVSVT
jgi:GNAT superfamily N-acetyltransferase